MRLRAVKHANAAVSSSFCGGGGGVFRVQVTAKFLLSQMQRRDAPVRQVNMTTISSVPVYVTDLELLLLSKVAQLRMSDYHDRISAMQKCRWQEESDGGWRRWGADQVRHPASS